MSEQERLTVYTQMALLNAIVLSLLGIQLIFSPAVLLLLWIVSTIFAIQAALMPLRLTLLSGALVILLALLLFGLDTCASATVYVSAGAVAGTLRRWKQPAALRILLTAVAMAALIAGLLAFLAWLLGLSTGNLLAQAQPYLRQFGGITTLALIGGLGLVGLALILAAAIDALTGNILSQLTQSNMTLVALKLPALEAPPAPSPVQQPSDSGH